MEIFKREWLLFLIVLFIDLPSFCKAQFREDSLRKIISLNKRDTEEVRALITLGYISNSFDTAFMFAQRGLELAEKLGYRKGVADGYLAMSWSFIKQRNYFQMVRYANMALPIFEAIHDVEGTIQASAALGTVYFNIGDLDKAKEVNMRCITILENDSLLTSTYPGLLHGHRLTPNAYSGIGELYLKANQPDSALYFARKAVDQNEYVGNALWNFPVYVLAAVYSRLGKYNESIQLYRTALSLAVKNGLASDTLQTFSGIANLYLQMKKPDSAIYFASQVNQSTDPNRDAHPWLEAIRTLKTGYKLVGNKDSALKYAELEKTLADSLFGKEQALNIQTFLFNEKFQQEEIKTVQEKTKRKIQGYIAIAGFLILLLIGLLLWRSNQRKQKAKAKIEKAYAELKLTQAQLIQSEKMASLGELTAGIAHEIQNPLNFVNNFSESNKELLLDMKQAIQQRDYEEVEAIANDLEKNEEKIAHHGRRADAIVKSMLQHSRTSTGEKQPTDLNALADEYLRLAFHGMRAKDKNFNAIVYTDFDENTGLVNVVPQDIGRVLLNLLNNAFYAVNEKRKRLHEIFEPAVTVTTKRLHDMVEILVKDNGLGIPQNIVGKIFQPFFTTKPTGEGTGLGLSLSYDIIKAHNGSINVETKEGEGTIFVVQLPVV